MNCPYNFVFYNKNTMPLFFLPLTDYSIQYSYNLNRGDGLGKP